MLNRNLADYIQEKLAIGYDINTIKNVLVGWGYNINDINKAISSLGSLKGQEGITKHLSLADLFLKPGRFFEDFDYNVKRALKYFLLAFFVVFLVQTIIIFVKNIIGGGIRNALILILTNTLVLLLFIFVLCLFLVLLVMVYFVLFGYMLKTGISFSLLFAMLFFSLLPYILSNSISGLGVYNLIGLVNVSIGFLNINLFFLWSLLLFSLAISRNLGVGFGKSIFFVFIPFLLVMGLLILVFYDIVRINLLWLVFEKF